MRWLFTPKNVDFGLSGQSFRLWFVGTILPTLCIGTTLLIFVCQRTDEPFLDRMAGKEITGGVTVD